jgi:alkanesulfonate monooxygenase SsuD/methylene tetrahydromethanopterin reductase-like flavin-dependent oxidoreductase (luciferase family)
VRRMVPSFAHYFRNLVRKGQASRGTALFKHEPSVPDSAVTDEYLASQLLISGTPNQVADRLNAFREQVGPFARLLYAGHDWGADANAMRRSMELMAGKVLPQL